MIKKIITEERSCMAALSFVVQLLRNTFLIVKVQHIVCKNVKRKIMALYLSVDKILLPLFKQFSPTVLPLGLSSLSLGKLITVSKVVKKITSTKENVSFHHSLPADGEG